MSNGDSRKKAPADGAEDTGRRPGQGAASMGLLTIWDIDSFSAYCQAYARWREAEEFITQHGSIFKTPSGYVQQVPQVSIAQQNLKIMQSLAGEFGLSPATRSRIIAAGGMSDKTSDDPMEQLLNGQWKEGE